MQQTKGMAVISSHVYYVWAARAEGFPDRLCHRGKWEQIWRPSMSESEETRLNRLLLSKIFLGDVSVWNFRAFESSVSVISVTNWWHFLWVIKGGFDLWLVRWVLVACALVTTSVLYDNYLKLLHFGPTKGSDWSTGSGYEPFGKCEKMAFLDVSVVTIDKERRYTGLGVSVFARVAECGRLGDIWTLLFSIVTVPITDGYSTQSGKCVGNLVLL